MNKVCCQQAFTIWTELANRFCKFQIADRRPELCRRLQQMIESLRRANILTELLVNGSFVTATPDPNDIDLILVVAPTHDFARELSPAEYNVLSAQRVKQRHKLDILAAREDPDQYRRYSRLFQQVRGQPQQTKGIVRIKL